MLEKAPTPSGQRRAPSFTIVRTYEPDPERQVRALMLLLSSSPNPNTGTSNSDSATAPSQVRMHETQEAATVGKTVAAQGVRDDAARPSH